MDEFNNPLKCGICLKGTHSYTTHQNDTEFYCQFCIHSKILKLKLAQINSEFFDRRARSEIDKVLGNCINGNPSIYLNTFLHSDHAEQTASDKTDKLQQLIPPDKSVARLAHMLLNVELAQYKKKLGQLELKIQENNSHNQVLQNKIAALDEYLKKQRQKLTNNRNKLTENHKINVTKVESLKKDLKDIKLRNIEKHIFNLRTKKVQNVIRILDVMVIENSMTGKDERSVLIPSTFLNSRDSNSGADGLLTKALQSSVRFEALPKADDLSLSIQFTPIIPLTKYLSYSVKLINESLEKVCVLINLMVSYLNICLPYPITRNRDQNGAELCFNGYYIQNCLTNESFPIFIESKNEKAEPLETILDLNSTQINNLGSAISRLIVNIVYLSQNIGRTIEIDDIQFNDLLKIDRLLVEMVRSYGFSKDNNKNEEISIKITTTNLSPFAQFFSKLRGVNNVPMDEMNEEESAKQREKKEREDEERIINKKINHLAEYMKLETLNLGSRIASENPLSSSTSSASTVQVPTLQPSNIITSISTITTARSLIQNVNELGQKIEEYFRGEIQKLYDGNNMSNTTNTIDSSTFQQVTISNLGAGVNSISRSRSRSDSPRSKPHNPPSLESSSGSGNLNGNGWKKNHRSFPIAQPSPSRLPKAGLSMNNKKPSLDNWEMI